MDKSGPAIKDWCTNYANISFEIVGMMTVSDTKQEIQQAVLELCSISDLVLTTGGTGFGLRDVTPEAIEPLLDKVASGLTIAMMTNSLEKTPMAALSRPICGLKNDGSRDTLIITLPGSVRGIMINRSYRKY